MNGTSRNVIKELLCSNLGLFRKSMWSQVRTLPRSSFLPFYSLSFVRKFSKMNFAKIEISNFPTIFRTMLVCSRSEKISNKFCTLRNWFLERKNYQENQISNFPTLFSIFVVCSGNMADQKKIQIIFVHRETYEKFLE